MYISLIKIILKSKEVKKKNEKNLKKKKKQQLKASLLKING